MGGGSGVAVQWSAETRESSAQAAVRSTLSMAHAKSDNYYSVHTNFRHIFLTPKISILIFLERI
jgi:hypothetical protein